MMKIQNMEIYKGINKSKGVVVMNYDILNASRPEYIPYEYKNLPIPGGGYVTGFLFHETVEDILYARTDIGGVYRYNFKEKRWVSLMDHVTINDLSETYPTAIGLDNNNPSYLYIACGCGDRKQGVFCISKDYGETFTYVALPCKVHGNNPGRGTGTRLIVDQNNEKIIYFASQSEGLLVSYDQGHTWNMISIEDVSTQRKNEKNLSFVFVDPRSLKGDCSQTIVIGTAGIDNRRNDAMRGHSLYISYNAGVSFSELPMPISLLHNSTKISGHVAQRYTFDGTYLYVTLACTGVNSYITLEGYSCDSGDSYDGKIIRYSFHEDGTVKDYKDITPNINIDSKKKAMIVIDKEDCTSTENDTRIENKTSKENDTNKVNKASQETDTDKVNKISIENDTYEVNETSQEIDTYIEIETSKENVVYDFGFSGISSCKAKPGLLMCTSICRNEGDIVLISEDYGESFRIQLEGLNHMQFQTSYMKPKYNGGENILHWCSDIKINPFDYNQAFMNSGTGIFMTADATMENSHWTDCCLGLEETVHLNVYSPPSGETLVIDILGDLGGFAFRDLTKPCDNSFDDEHGNRYITCLNADYSDFNTDYVVVTPRGNWKGKTIGGLIVSKDNCKTFKYLNLPFGISSYIDSLLRQIATPNVNSGWVALSSDCKTIVWSVANHLSLPVEAIIYSKDEGQSFQLCKVLDQKGVQVIGITIKVFADRVNPDLFYAFSEDSRIFISVDGGVCFNEKTVEDTFPKQSMSEIDSRNRVEIRAESGREGTLWIAMNYDGLWKLIYQKEEDKLSIQRISSPGDSVFCVGLGIGEEGDYFKSGKTLYVAAILNGVYGFYRSSDEGNRFVRINNDKQMFGEIKSIDGDSRTFGRFYIATGSRGVLYGVPVN